MTPPLKGAYQNLELGAGKSDFGKTFYPVCCLSDKDEKELLRITPSHSIHYFFNAYEMPSWTHNYFKKVIMCNPYHYGFKDKEVAQSLLEGIVRAIDGKGEIIVISKDINSWGRPNKVISAIELYAETNTDVTFKHLVEDIDATTEYPNFTFYDCLGESVTVPNKRVIIDVTK